MNDQVNSDIPAGSETVLRQLFKDEFHENPHAAESGLSNEQFIQNVMRNVAKLQRRELYFRILPGVAMFVGVVLVASLMLLPYLPQFFTGLEAQLSNYSVTLSSGAGLSSIEGFRPGILMPTLVLLLALAVPAAIDRFNRTLGR